MISNISLMTVWVDDQDEALAFYTDKLGFELREDVTMGDYRWLTIGHPDQPDLKINLSVPGPPLDDEAAGYLRRMLANGTLNGARPTGDAFRETYEELSARGVTFLNEPAARPYGVEAVLRDNPGNWWVLVEPRPFEPSAP